MELRHWKIDEERLLVAGIKTTEASGSEDAYGALSHRDLRYRRYTIEEIEEATENFADSRKIGEGGYGPVYKCYLDHTPVAVKVLRSDAAHGMSQFQQEVIHPFTVLFP